MSGKILLKAGFLFLRDTKYGLTDVKVATKTTLAEVGDPEQNLEFLMGRQEWAFSATIFVRDSFSLAPSTAPEAIAIVYDSKAWYGTGVVNSVTEVGRLSDAIVYNVEGRFQNASYQIELLPTTAGNYVNTFTWPDDDGNGIPNGFIDQGSQDTWSIPVTTDYGPYLRTTWDSAGDVDINHSAVDYATGFNYRAYMPYKIFTNTIGGFHRLRTSGPVATALETAPGSHVLDIGYVAASAQDRIGFEHWGDLGNPYTIHYLFLISGLLVNSI